MYQVLLTLHILAAIVGIGVVFSFPFILKRAQTKSQLQFSLGLVKKLEIFPKTGGILLILTGIGLGILHNGLFHQIWFIASIILFVIIEILVIGIIPKKMAPIAECVFHAQGDSIPVEYRILSKKAAPFHGTVHTLTLIIILLMIFKP